MTDEPDDPDEDDVTFTAQDDHNRALLARRLHRQGFVQHAVGFWVAPDVTLPPLVHQQPEDGETAE